MLNVQYNKYRTANERTGQPRLRWNGADAEAQWLRLGTKGLLPLWAFYFNCRTCEAAHAAAIIEKDGTATHQTRAEDAPSKHAQFKFIYMESVAIKMGTLEKARAWPPPNEQFKLPKQSVRHDAIVQSEDRCALPHTPLPALLNT